MKQQFEVNSDLSVQELEYFKDIWDIRILGGLPSPGRNLYSVNFTSIKQDWLKKAAKKYARYALTVKSFATVRAVITAINHFSKFIQASCPYLQPQKITRLTITDFLSYLAKVLPKTNTRATKISNFNAFLYLCQREQWLNISKELLVYKEDYPSKTDSIPKFIPQEVIDQLNNHLDKLPLPIARMVIILQECGMRSTELCLLKFNCLAQDKTGSWWLTYYQSKMKKEISIPISKETAQVVGEQQVYIKGIFHDFPYLFCSRGKGGGNRKTYFIPKPIPMAYISLTRCLKKLAENNNICDAQGNIFPLEKIHQFRHTVGTNMINSGVPLEIIRRFLGHESFTMTIRYARIYDQTLKQKVEKYNESKVINITGETVESQTTDLDTSDMQWFKKNMQAQALPNGYCKLPLRANGCPHPNACLSCGEFLTTIEFLEVHKQELENTNKIIDKAKQNRWQRQVEMNEKVKHNLEVIIDSLETGNGN